MLARNWERDKGKIHAVFDLFKRLVYPVWLVSFVEGTRYDLEKIKQVIDHVSLILLSFYLFSPKNLLKERDMRLPSGFKYPGVKDSLPP